jgi:hypothetical protein
MRRFEMKRRIAGQWYALTRPLSRSAMQPVTLNYLGRLFAFAPRDDVSSPVEQDACDHEHCRYREHVCKSFRGCPLGGLFHAVFSLNLGMTHRCVNRTQDRQNFLLGTPLVEQSRIEPLRSDCRRGENRIVLRRQFGSAMLLLRQTADTVLAKSTTTYDNPKVTNGPYRLQRFRQSQRSHA